MPTINTDTLLSFLQVIRPANSQAEQAYCGSIIALCKQLGYKPIIDGYGNIVVNNLQDTASRVMFTSHTDSIHRGANLPHTQNLLIGDGIVTVNHAANKTLSSCLGADDATGNYIMLRLLQANVHGLYVFFRDEEVGGLGSSFFAKSPDNQDLLKSLTHCISFDRKGYNSVITEQFSGRCCSDEFAIELASRITKNDTSGILDFEPDPTGSFTDSANFTDVIPECTNLSVGYFDQHTTKERQDVSFVETLCESLEKINWGDLPVFRDPNVLDDWYTYNRGYGYDVDYDAWDIYGLEISGIKNGGYQAALDLVMRDPELAAEMLVEFVR